MSRPRILAARESFYYYVVYVHEMPLPVVAGIVSAGTYIELLSLHTPLLSTRRLVKPTSYQLHAA